MGHINVALYQFVFVQTDRLETLITLCLLHLVRDTLELQPVITIRPTDRSPWAELEGRTCLD